MIIRPKSTFPCEAARSRASRVALSSWAVMQYIPEPLVNREVVFSNASPRSVPEKYTSEVATSQLMIDGARAAAWYVTPVVGVT